MTLAPDLDALIRAQGILAATLESLLIAKGVLQPGELLFHLASMAEISPETDDRSADILEGWMGMLAQVDEAAAGGRRH